MPELQNLYFIGLIPHETLLEKITVLKRNFAEYFESAHSLKTAPHITLVQPFKRTPDFEVEMHLQLQYFFEKENSFEIELKNFGCFDKRKSKVIFIEVEANKQLKELHKRMIYFLRNELKFSDREASYMFHPHITLAHRDLTDENFDKAWSIYKNHNFSDSFAATKAYLLKHNFRKWEVLSVFDLKKQN